MMGELTQCHVVKLDKAPIGNQFFSASSANSVKDMLELVVQEGWNWLQSTSGWLSHCRKKTGKHIIGRKWLRAR